MKLKFTRLDYQQRAIETIFEVLHGTNTKEDPEGRSNPKLEFNLTNLSSIIVNIQKKSKLEQHSCYTSPRNDVSLNLDIMMETGTGKTITFIETIYRLNKKYGLSKFIIVVPTSAIRLGTIKNISITKEYFLEYEPNIEVFDNTQVKQFIGSSNRKINVLITTFQAFNKTSNTINKNNIEGDLVDGATSFVEAIRNINPIVIIDEPHRADGEKTQKALEKFTAPLTIRFGATFNDYNNLIYALDSNKAFKDGLVKGIDVHTVGDKLDISLEYRGNRKICYSVAGKEIIKEVNNHDNLAQIFDDYNLSDYIVDISGNAANPKVIRFLNGCELLPNNKVYCDSLKEEVTKTMINEAIIEHFVKERRLFEHNIKTLSLFFIDNVNSYYKDKNKDGELSILFEKLYKIQLEQALSDETISIEYRKYLQQSQTNISSVHDGYFAKSNSDKDNQEAIDLILRAKEKMLSFDTPLKFIFSKWALREGWDNPNIFVITKLSPSSSNISKLQQIGRGLRLAVDINGNRITKEYQYFEQINNLTVIIPSIEKDFVTSIQEEINAKSIENILEFNNLDLINKKICNTQKEANNLINVLVKAKVINNDDDYKCKIINCDYEYITSQLIKYKTEFGVVDLDRLKKFVTDKAQGSGRISNKRTPKMVKIDTQKFNKFKELWSYINSRSKINYQLDSDILLDNIVANINSQLNIKPRYIEVTHTSNVHDKDKISRHSSKRTQVSINEKNTIKHLINKLSLETKLTHGTIINILRNINKSKFKMIVENYIQSVDAIIKICIDEMHKLMLQKFDIDVIETNIINTSLTDSSGNLKKEIDVNILGKELLELNGVSNIIKQKSLFEEYMAYDSEIEKNTIESSNNISIQVFAKLPRISINTPIGKYNPDFAYVLQKQGTNKQVYLVIETKGYDHLSEVNQRELDKITVAEKFFKAIQKKFPLIKIEFRKMINKEKFIRYY